MGDDQQKEISPSQEIDFCTLGMFIIDEIHYQPPSPSVYDIIGGGGAYAAVAARIFSQPPLSRTIAWIVDKGNDFPSSVENQINSWDTSCLLRTDNSRLTTRGWNSLDAQENRAFKYLTPKLRLDASSLSPELLFSKSFHLLCSPTRCISLVNSILRARKRVNEHAEKPVFIWEPVPDLCLPTELLNLTNALPYVDICSPNHAELAALMGDPEGGIDPKTGLVSTTAVERACEQLLSGMPLQSYSLVVRCGAQGCYVAKNGGRTRRPSIVRRKRPRNHARGGLTLDMDMEALFAGLLNGEESFERVEVEMDPGVECWLPAYFSSEESTKQTHTAVDSLAVETPKVDAPAPIPAGILDITSSESEVAVEGETTPKDIVEAGPDAVDPLAAEIGPADPQSLSEPTEEAEKTETLPSSTTTMTLRPAIPKTRVIDPTGGGNAFLGGMAVALARGHGLEESAVWGSVAASFAIEQVGMPLLGHDAEGHETWNGERMQDRLDRLMARIKK